MKVAINWDKFDSRKYRPLAVEEIPDFKPGTISYDDYWDEQDNRCINGYKPNPYMPKITGEHYFYMNMNKIELLKKGASRKTYESPFYRELDRRVYDEIHEAKKNRYGLIIGKPRRVGLSWIGANTSVYELLFHKGNKIGVAAGQDDKAQDFYEKVKDLLKNIRPEYRSGTLVKNSEEIKLGYIERINKQNYEKGLQSQLFMKTMYAKPTGFEGKSLSLVIFEEAGLFVDIVSAYKSTEPCFKEGSHQFGTPIIYGTGGDIDKGSKGYKEIWYKPSVYNLKKIFISSTDYYPGDGIPDKTTGKIISFFDFRTGRTNSKMAYDYIMKERLEKEGSEGFIKHIQSYPLKEADIFIKNSGGHLNRKKLNAQMRNQDNCPYKRTKGKLEWVTKDHQTLKLVAIARDLKEIDKIHFNRGSKLKFVEDEELGTINKILDPIRKERLPYNPDIGGNDSYDEDNPGDQASLGATIIYRCFYGVNSPSDIPVAYILDRGTADSDDEFYSQTLRLSIWYDIELLVEYTKIAIIQYFKDVGATDYLKARPDLSASMGYNSRAKNEFGFKMSNHHAWTITLRLLKAEVNKNFNNYWFIEILEHLVDYGESNSDLGSALGMVLISKLDLFAEMTDGLEDSEDEGSVIDNMGFYDLVNGEMVFTTYGESRKDKMDDFHTDDPFTIKKIRSFNPEIDLEGQEREKYYEAKVNTRKKIQEKRDEVLEKYGGDIMAFTLEQYNNRIKEN